MASRDPIPAGWQRVLAALAIVALTVYVVDTTAATILPFLRRVLDVLSPFIIAFAIAYVLDPLVDRLEDRGWSRKGAIGFVAVVSVLLLVLVVIVVVPAFIGQLHDLGPRLRLYGDRLGEGLASAATWLRDEAGLPLPADVEGFRELRTRALEGVDWQRIAATGAAWVGSAVSGGAVVLATLLNLVLIPILTVYLLADIDPIKDRLADLVPARLRGRVLEPLAEVDRALAGFVRGQLTVAAFLAVFYMVGLFASRAPLGLVIGAFAGAVSFIPYLGLILGLVPALLLTSLEHGVISWNVLGVVATFVIAQLVEGNLITPRIMGRSVGLHPVLVIVAVVAGGTFFGLSGLLLGVPAAAAAMVFVRRAHARYVDSRFFRGPPPEPDATSGEGKAGAPRRRPRAQPEGD